MIMTEEDAKVLKSVLNKHGLSLEGGDELTRDQIEKIADPYTEMTEEELHSEWERIDQAKRKAEIEKEEAIDSSANKTRMAVIENKLNVLRELSGFAEDTYNQRFGKFTTPTH